MMQRPSGAAGCDGGCARPRLLLLIPAIFLIAADLNAWDWWNRIPYMEWPGNRAHELLTNSPWVALSPAGFRRGEDRVITNGIATRHTGYPIRCFFLVRMLTARPIREALLRAISLQGTLLDIRKGSMARFENFAAIQEQERLKSFMESWPDDLRIKGNDRQIIISVTLRIDDRSGPREESFGKELAAIDIERMMRETILSTDTGKRVGLSCVRQAGPDRLGVKFYFPRTLPDGQPLISAVDRELRFSTAMNGTPVRVKYNLRKMFYHGELEN